MSGLKCCIGGSLLPITASLLLCCPLLICSHALKYGKQGRVYGGGAASLMVMLFGREIWDR